MIKKFSNYTFIRKIDEYKLNKIYFFFKIRNVVKNNNFKVFSAKLEDTLTRHPAIGMIATIGIPNPDRPGSVIVKAFIQLNPDYEYDGNEAALKDNITKFVKKNCSPYEVPKIIEISEKIPLTLLGKVDRKILRPPKL